MPSGDELVSYGRQFVGTPYVWGGAQPGGFDCSGFVQYVFKKFGIELPRVSRDQANVGTAVSKNPSGMQPGDLVFSNWDGGRVVTHVSMYAGNGQLLSARAPGKPLALEPYNAAYQARTLAVRRVAGISGSGGGTTAGGTPTGATGDLTGALGGVATGFSSLASAFMSLPKVFDLILKLLLPETWVRIMAMILGIVFAGAGIFFLAREAR